MSYHYGLYLLLFAQTSDSKDNLYCICHNCDDLSFIQTHKTEVFNAEEYILWIYFSPDSHAALC